MNPAAYKGLQGFQPHRQYKTKAEKLQVAPQDSTNFGRGGEVYSFTSRKEIHHEQSNRDHRLPGGKDPRGNPRSHSGGSGARLVFRRRKTHTSPEKAHRGQYSAKSGGFYRRRSKRGAKTAVIREEKPDLYGSDFLCSIYLSPKVLAHFFQLALRIDLQIPIP